MALVAGAGLVVLLILHRDAGRLNDEIVTTGRPARELLGEVQVAFARRVYTLQEYLLTRDESYLATYHREDERVRGLIAEMAPLLERMGVGTPLDARLADLMAAWSAPLNRLLSGTTEEGVFGAEAAERDALHAETLLVISALRDEINGAISARLERIRTLETGQVLIAVSLAVLALAAAVERTRLAGLERASRAEAEQRARREAALREAAAAVASARTVEETVRRIAESALSSTGAQAAVVERIDPDTAEVEIVATSGGEDCGPRLRQRFDYADSVSRRVMEKRAPVRWNAAEHDGSRDLRPYLREGCGGGKLLAVPLLDANRAMGSLILLRTAYSRDFGDEEADRLRIFGDLAALEFRRMSMLAESERRRRELERVTESRARLLRGFSHDVKNALGAADGYAQLLEEGVMGSPSAKQRLGIGHLRDSLGGALKLTEDLLHLARAEAGHIKIDRVSTDVVGLAAAMTEAYRPQAENKGIEMSLDLEDELPPLRSDPTRIQQVLGNLLSNAVKYTPGGGHIRIVAGRAFGGDAPRAGSWLRLSVVDDGPGIPDDQQSSVFDEFVRLAPDQGAGSGLGLAISRRVAWALNGDLTVKSAPGSGCEFTLWLPLDDASSVEARGHAGSVPGPIV